MPKQIFHLEHEIKSMVKDFAMRGKINVFVNLKSLNSDGVNGLQINDESVTSYLQLLKRLKKKYKLYGKLRLDHLLAFSDLFIYEEDILFRDQIWEAIKETLDRALNNFTQMRKDEGVELERDLSERILQLDEKVNRIEQISLARHDEELEKLKQRVAEIVKIGIVDETRLETEVAFLMNRIDVTEECVRFKSHNKLFLSSMNSDEAVGRKLNFLLQEMTREANTIGSKANHADISHLVVEIKEEIEKIREQVQNIE